MDDQGDRGRLEAPAREFRPPLRRRQGQRVAPGVAEVDRGLFDHFAVGEHPWPGDATALAAELAGVEGAAIDLDQGVADAVLELAEVGSDGFGARLSRWRLGRHGAGISASVSPTALAKPASASSSWASDRKPTSNAEGASM